MVGPIFVSLLLVCPGPIFSTTTVKPVLATTCPHRRTKRILDYFWGYSIRPFHSEHFRSVLWVHVVLGVLEMLTSLVIIIVWFLHDVSPQGIQTGTESVRAMDWKPSVERQYGCTAAVLCQPSGGGLTRLCFCAFSSFFP